VKAHISATIDNQLVEDLNRYGLEERRSRSQVIEMALKEFLRRRLDLKDEIVTSEGQFQGRFSR
jgi:metal-responsive CopG/Arc/MetJ family transcriptional regulator